MLKITDDAINQFKFLLSGPEDKGSGVRVFASQGCCGPSFGMDFSKDGEPGDITMAQDGLKIFMEPGAASQLEEAVIDFRDTPRGKSFLITGLPASSSCCS